MKEEKKGEIHDRQISLPSAFFEIIKFTPSPNCKIVRIFAYSSTREQSNKRSGARLKAESETE